MRNALQEPYEPGSGCDFGVGIGQKVLEFDLSNRAMPVISHNLQLLFVYLRHDDDDVVVGVAGSPITSKTTTNNTHSEQSSLLL
jgi:hypothetical protein